MQIFIKIWNIIFQCVTEFVTRTVTAQSKTAVTTVSKNNMHDKNEEKVDDILTNQNADDEKPKTKSNLGLPVEENPDVKPPIIINEIAKQLYETITIFSNNESIQNYMIKHLNSSWIEFISSENKYLMKQQSVEQILLKFTIKIIISAATNKDCLNKNSKEMWQHICKNILQKQLVDAANLY